MLFLYTLVHAIEKIIAAATIALAPEEQSFVEQWDLRPKVQESIEGSGLAPDTAFERARLITILARFDLPGTLGRSEVFMADPMVGEMLRFNTFDKHH